MILNMPVPQVGQVPFMALRPFAMVTSAASFMSRFALHFTQYASTAAAIGVEYYWVERADKVIIPRCHANCDPRSSYFSGMEPRYSHFLLPALLLPAAIHAQTLVDSIPYPGINQGFWGIHVNADTIFLGADFSGAIYFSDHEGTILGQLPTGYDFNHGLVRRPSSYLIAEDYTTNGAGLYEVDLAGNLINSWTFPDVIGGNSSGIGDLCADGDAVWYTMYFPDFDVYPYAYAYKWLPGDVAPSDTVPLWGEQPYGIALKGDTLFYVTDDLNGDEERIYAYDLANEVDLGWVELPDTPIDNDQRPQGMHYDGTYLYLVANRQGGSAFAYQTVFKYRFDVSTAVFTLEDGSELNVFPTLATEFVHVESTTPGIAIEVRDGLGRMTYAGTTTSTRLTLDLQTWAPGPYVVRTVDRTAGITARRFLVVR